MNRPRFGIASGDTIFQTTDHRVKAPLHRVPRFALQADAAVTVSPRRRIGGGCALGWKTLLTPFVRTHSSHSRLADVAADIPTSKWRAYPHRSRPGALVEHNPNHRRLSGDGYPDGYLCMMRAGHQLRTWNRSPAPVDTLVAQGALRASVRSKRLRLPCSSQCWPKMPRYTPYSSTAAS